MPMIRVKSFVSSVQSPQTDACSNGTSTNSLPSPTTAAERIDSVCTTSCLRGVCSHASHEVKRPMSERSKAHTRSVRRFMDKHDPEPESGSTESWYQTPQLAKEKGKETSSILSRDFKGLNSLFKGCSDEKGTSKSVELPPDAAKELLSMAKPRFKIKGAGLKAVDTMSTTPPSSRDEFYSRRTRKSVLPTVQITHSLRRQNGHDDQNHERPAKRARTTSSPLKGSPELSIISLDDSDDQIPSSRLMHNEGIASRAGEMQKSERNLTVDIPSSNHCNRSQDSPRCLRTASSQQGSAVQQSGSGDESEDEVRPLLTTKYKSEAFSYNKGLNEENKRAQQQLDDMLLSSSPVTTSRKTTPPQRKSSRHHGTGRPQSRIEQRFYSEAESPDALQIEGVTSLQWPRDGSDSGHRQNIRTPVRTRNHESNNRKLAHKSNSSAINGNQQETSFDLLPFNYYGAPVADGKLVLDADAGKIILAYKDPILNDEPITEFKVSDVLQTVTCSQDGRARMFIRTRKANVNSKLVFEFQLKDEMQNFQDSIEKLDSRIKHKEDTSVRMNSRFLQVAQDHKNVRELDEARAESSKRQLNNNPMPTKDLRSGREVNSKRRRLIDGLDVPPALKSQNTMTVISGVDRAGETAAERDLTDREMILEEADRVALTKLPSSKGPLAGERRLRSNHEKRASFSSFFNHSTVNEEPTKAKISLSETIKPWKQPLVYPPLDKKRETVHFEDLQRLDEDEFLNDNLVSLFLRYLEFNAKKSAVKKIHLFNSFLFEALTKDTKVRRGINFDAVKRWTTKVDLFNRDFIVVPVNENFHWFSMIICNLSYFKTKHEFKTDYEDEDDSDVNLAEDSDLQPNVILESDLEIQANEASARDSFADMTLEDSVATPFTGSSKSSHGGSGREKQTSRTLPKYDLKKPVIITLDSLGEARSTTTSALRQYIVAEAKDKKSWDIDASEIKGMTAKGIPRQGNFSDCGLYLCMYLEQFMLDPYAFVRSILQRTDELRWPRSIESSCLRNRLRTMLLDLHEQQQSGTTQSAKIAPLGSILVTMNSSEDEKKEAEKSAAQLEAATDQWENNKTLIVSRGSDISQDDVSVLNEATIQDLSDWRNTVNRPISIEDDSNPIDGTESTIKQSSSTSPYFSKPQVTSQFESELVEAAKQHVTPRKGISDDHERSARATSVSTDDLVGDRTYLDHRTNADDETSKSTQRVSSTTQHRITYGSRPKFQRGKRQDERAAAKEMEIEDVELPKRSLHDMVTRRKHEVQEISSTSVLGSDGRDRKGKRKFQDFFTSDEQGDEMRYPEQQNSSMLV